MQASKTVSYDIIVADFSIHSSPAAVCFCIEVGFQLLGDKYFLQRRKCPRDLTGAISSAVVLILQNNITAKIRMPKNYTKLVATHSKFKIIRNPTILNLPKH